MLFLSFPPLVTAIRLLSAMPAIPSLSCPLFQSQEFENGTKVPLSPCGYHQWGNAAITHSIQFLS